jgi:hypothetical protein
MAPVSALGNRYVAAPYTTRRADLKPESVPYRLVGMVNGTTLQWEPQSYGMLPGVNAGQVLDFETDKAFTVRSQDPAHPFSLAQLMTGCNVTSGSRPGCTPVPDAGASDKCLGDEEFVNLLPPAQFQSTYIFFTDPSYATTNLVFVRPKTSSGFKDVTLDCAGTLTRWQPIGSAGDYEFTNVDLVRALAKNGSCDNGPHSATSEGEFGLMVWGLDDFASYAYPAGGNVTPLNTILIPPVPK